MNTPKIHPDLAAKWQVAKRAAAALASACGAVLLQSPEGKPRVELGNRLIDFPTWFAAWSYLYRIRRDQLGIGR